MYFVWFSRSWLARRWMTGGRRVEETDIESELRRRGIGFSLESISLTIFDDNCSKKLGRFKIQNNVNVWSSFKVQLPEKCWWISNLDSTCWNLDIWGGEGEGSGESSGLKLTCCCCCDGSSTVIDWSFGLSQSKSSLSMTSYFDVTLFMKSYLELWILTKSSSTASLFVTSECEVSFSVTTHFSVFVTSLLSRFSKGEESGKSISISCGEGVNRSVSESGGDEVSWWTSSVMSSFSDESGSSLSRSSTTMILSMLSLKQLSDWKITLFSAVRGCCCCCCCCWCCW